MPRERAERPADQRPRSRRAIVMMVALAAALVVVGSALAIPQLREPALRAAGHALLVAEPLAPVDVIVVSLDSAGAGALEAADLVAAGIARRVAVFRDPPSVEDHEFIRRGLPYEDAGARQLRQLRMLGVTDTAEIARIDGTAGESRSLPSWSEKHGLRSIVFVTSRDHARRTRRALSRAFAGSTTRIIIRPSRYSRFDPDRWWQSRGGVRIAIIEWQKLVLDYVLHPWPS